MNALVPTSIHDALQLADIMAKASLIPEHLRNKPGDCLLIVMQAQRWGMDAVSVAQCTSVVRGKLCYEGKLVAAALYAMGAIDGRLRYDFSGNGESRKVTVTGRPRGTTVDQSVDGTVADWKTDNGNWKKSPDDMLVYRGTRQWARRYAPEALLGVYTPDELEEAPQTVDARVVATIPAGSAELPPYSDADFNKNLATWGSVIESGRKTAAEIIAMVSAKGVLSEEQKARIFDYAPPTTSSDGNAEDQV
ncbi:recombinase RecT [Lysobacter fragariae]